MSFKNAPLRRSLARKTKPQQDEQPTSNQHEIIRLQSMIGNRAVQRMFSEGDQNQSIESSHNFSNQSIEPEQFTEGDRAEVPLNPSETRKEFSPEEKQWIQEIWTLPEVERLFQAYDQVPEPVLLRVMGSTSEGINRGEGILIDDTTYTQLNSYKVAEERADADEFKSTFLHELLHYFMAHTASIDPNKITTPKSIENLMLAPHKFNYNDYAFGWFVHPIPFKDDKGNEEYKTLHLDKKVTDNKDPRYLSPNDPRTQALSIAQENGTYEKSPMSQSGLKISIEEDVAESMSLYLSGPESRAKLAAEFPLRFALMEQYFNIALLNLIAAKK